MPGLDAQPRWDGFDILWLQGNIVPTLGQVLAPGLDELLDVTPPPAIVAREVVPEFMISILAASVPKSLRTT